MSTADRLREVSERVADAARKAGRRPEEVALIAVAKTATPDTLREAWAAGQRRFGHNRVQALEAHHAVLPEAEWHLIGPVQGNKVRRAAALASWIQTVGEARTAERLARVLQEEEAGSAPRPILVQVNLTPEDGRYGCPAGELAPLLERLAGAGALEVRGLMTIAPHGAPSSELRRHFAALAQLARAEAEVGRLPAASELSMGMTEDFEVAVEEGATLVRIGRAIFTPPDSP